MRIFLFFLLVSGVAIVLFWNSIFGTSDENSLPEESGAPAKTVVLAPENKGDSEAQGNPDYRGLMNQGRWAEALSLLREDEEATRNHAKLVDMHRCLVKLKREQDAEKVMMAILNISPQSQEAVSAILLSAESGKMAPLQIRQRLSQVGEGLGLLDIPNCRRLVGVLRKINARLPGSIAGLYASEKYTVVPNDCLWNICKKIKSRNNVSIESGLICMLNNIKGDKIFPGQTLSIPKEKIDIRIWRNNWLLAVFVGDALLTAYQVGLGADDRTPGGKFDIMTRLKEPDWYSEQHGKLIPYGDSQNILGTRWLGFENRDDARGFGIHGTVDPDSICDNRSSGCIRLLNEDVEELFEIVARGTGVEVY